MRRPVLWWRRFVALTAAAVLGPVLAVPTLPQVASAEPATPDNPSTCAEAQSDISAAREAARQCGRRVELLPERTETSQTFVNADGTFTLEESLEPERVRKGSSWVPVNTSLKVTAAGVVPRASVLPMVFSAGGDGALARLSDGDRSLAMSWPGRLPAPVVRGDTATYRDVLPGVDLRVTAQALGFSEVLVVRTREAAASPRLASLRFGLATTGLTVGAAAGGGLVARDGNGRAVFTAPAPLMWDSSVGDGVAGSGPAGGKQRGKADKPSDPSAAPPKGSVPDGARRAVMPVRVDGDSLTIVPSRTILTDPNAKLPIYIDPSWTGSISGSAWTSVWSKYRSTSFWRNASALQDGSTKGAAGAGRTEDWPGAPDHIIRSFFRMDTSRVRGLQILSAKFRVEQRWAWTCNPVSNAKLWLTGPISSSTTWSSQPGWNGTYVAQTKGNRKVGAVHGCLGTGTIEFNTTSIVRKAAASRWSTVTLGLRAIDEGTLSQWKRFNHSSPKLAITFNTPPLAPSSRLSDGKACATGSARPYVRTLTPTLAAKQVDPDGGTPTTSFYWWAAGGSLSETNKVAQTAGNGTVSKTIPSGKLVDGGTYVWKARTTDPYTTGPWSATCEFAVDVTAPAAPSLVDSAQYPAEPDTAPGHGGVGINGEFWVTPSATGAGDAVSYAWTTDPGVAPAGANHVAANGSQPVKIDYTPVRDGVHTLRVWAKDKAGWYSPTPYSYGFKVRSGAGPAGQWSFNEDAGDATDATGHSNTLVPSGATRVPGRSGVGKALSLDGTDDYAASGGPVTMPHPDTPGEAIEVATDSSFTVTAWVKLPATGGSAVSTAVAVDGTQSSAFSLGYDGTANKWRFAVAGADSATPVWYAAVSNAAPVTGRWAHLAGVYDVSTKAVRLFVNGTLQTSTATVAGGFHASGPLTVGRHRAAGAGAGYFAGQIDEVYLYAYAVPTADLVQLTLPIKASITLSSDQVDVGATATAEIASGGDTNITSYRYSIGSTALDQSAAPAAPGGSVSVQLPTSSAGVVKVYAVAVDGNGRQSSEHTFAVLTVGLPATLTGVVFDSDYAPLPGAVVTVESLGRSAAAGDDGSYTVTGLVSGIYTVKATYGGPCGLAAVVENVEIDGDAYLDLQLTPVSDDQGYQCDTGTAAFTSTDTTVPLTGDDAVTAVSLPFVFPFYGGNYRTAWVDTNGILSFTDPGGSHPYDGSTLPSAAEPNALIAPFWDDLVVDAQSSVRTSSTGSDLAARFTVEWRNVARKANTAERLSFQVTLSPDGTVTTNYDGLDTDAERGAASVVGIEAPAGEDGLTYSVKQPVLADGKTVTFDYPGTGRPVDVFDLSGHLTNASGAAVAGATVTLDPSGLSATTASDGSWRFDDVVADSYAVSSVGSGRCPLVARSQVELTGDTVRDLTLAPDAGDLGYSCTVGPSGYVAASTALSLTGDDVAAKVTMPFPITFHGRSHTIAWIHTNGLVSFGDESGEPDAWVNPTMPTTKAPNAVVAPFWDDLNVDASASVRVQVLGTAPNRSYVVEWRNVLLQVNKTDRVTFEVIFDEGGRIGFHYTGMSTPAQYGSGATVGLENASGTVAALYSYQESALAPNTSIVYTPAARGTVSGTLTTAVTGAPVAGRTVTLDPGGLTTTTGADGSYQFSDVAVGEYTLTAATGDSRCAGRYAKETVNHAGGVSDVDLSLMTAGDEFGYTCTAGAQTFTAAAVAEGWSGDDTVWQKNPPFPVKLYGNTYTSAWISANGLMTFKDPAYFGWIGAKPSPIPSAAAEGVPNAAVYALWDDWVVDSQARIATGVTGTAPNRRWTVEWRNVHRYGDTATRVSFEAIFEEAGGITFAYTGIDSANLAERGGKGLVGIENASGTIAFQYLYQDPLLANGQGTRYAPGAPGSGTVTGTVTCQGTPVSGAAVAVAGKSATTAGDGTYQVTGVTAGTYAVIATLGSGSCHGSQVANLTVGTNTTHTADFIVGATATGAGYTIAEQPVTYTAANGTTLPLAGDDAYTAVNLPFPVNLYGATYNTGWVDTNGLVAFVDPGEASPDAWPIPSPDSPEEPNAALYPLWHDWVVDSNASVRTATLGAAPNRQFIVEWRNVYSYEDPTTRVSFEVIFDEAGGYRFAYTDIDGTFLELGGGATVGIENADGTIALQYTYRQPVMRPGLGLRITPPTS
ncbi:MAG: carboxypeptidase regulatory-like domain-containing protein [Micromonosporaceae bacterium]